MEIAHLTLKGKSKKKFFSSYICHPAMANNELSGPVVVNALIKYIKKKFPKENILINLYYSLKLLDQLLICLNLKIS